MIKLTGRRQEVYELIADYMAKHGASPTLEEIMRELKVKAKSTVHEHVKALEVAGLIRREGHKSRGITLVGADELAARPAIMEIPLLGYVAAGAPNFAFALSQETVTVPTEMLKHGSRTYALRVRGDSMIGAHICDGDTILVESRQTAEAGEMVVALVDGTDATLKWFSPERDGIRLVPANSKYKTIIIKPPERCQVQGVVTGVMRRGVKRGRCRAI